MTKATIKKAAKEAGIDLSLIKITKIGGVYGLEDTDLPADLAKRNMEYEGAGQLPEVLFDVKIVGGTLSIDDESTEYGWFSFEDALQCPLADSQRIRINDVIQYYYDKKMSF